MSFQLRPYQSSDFEVLYALDCACFPRGIAFSRSMLRAFIGARASVCLVAEEDTPSGAAAGGGEKTSQILGFIVGEVVGETGRESAHIITLDVATAHRRSGVGSALLVELERRLALAGARRVELETATDNQVAIAFWQRHGYRTVGVIERYYLNRIDALAMAKPLEAAPQE